MTSTIEVLEQMSDAELFQLWKQFDSFRIHWTAQNSNSSIIFNGEYVEIRDLGTWISVNRPYVVIRFNKLKAFL